MRRNEAVDRDCRLQAAVGGAEADQPLVGMHLAEQDGDCRLGRAATPGGPEGTIKGQFSEPKPYSRDPHKASLCC
jgi:hypothetical protein